MNDLSTTAFPAFSPVLLISQAGVQAGATPAQPAFADPVSAGTAAGQPTAPVTPGAPVATGTAAVPGTVTTQPLPPAVRPAGGMDMIFWLLPVMLIVMIVFSVLTGRKEKKKKEELISAIKKHDKVQMLGGIIGTVAEVGDEDIVVRVEEGRIRFAKSAVAAVLTSAKASGALESKPDGKSDSRSDSKSSAKAAV